MKSLTQGAVPNEKVTNKATLKRRVGYTEEEVSITRAKLAKMKISEGREGSEERDNDSNEEMNELEDKLITK